MAVKVKLEKDGFKKDAYVGFSWTTLFLGIWVPSFRLDLKGFLVFLGIMLFQTSVLLLAIIKFLNDFRVEVIPIFFFLFLGTGYIVGFLLAFFYNKIYTKNMLLDGWKPMDNDEYSLTILANYGYIEYEIDEKDEEKIARCEGYIREIKRGERRKLLIIIIPVIFILIVVFFIIFELISTITTMRNIGY